MASNELNPSKGASPTPLPQGVLPRPFDQQNRYRVVMEAYIQMSFEEEVEITGFIGDELFAAESRSSRRGIRVGGSIGSEAIELKVGLRRLRSLPVSGYVLGQQVEGALTNRGGTVIFDGKAGQEPLRYELDSRGNCTNFDTNLGIKILYQAFYSEVVGSVERVPDAAMIGLLLPVALYKRDPT